MNKSNSGISRRNLIKGAALLSAGALVSLPGCAAPSKGSASASAESEAAKKVDKTYEADVAIVGGGASGVACMLKSLENGLSVILVEQSSAVGGATLAGVSTMFCLESKYHGPIGMGDLTPGDIMAIEHANSQYRSNGSLWLKMIRESDTYRQWIEDNGGSFTPYAEVPLEWMLENAINCNGAFQLPPLIMADGGDVQCVSPLFEAAEALGGETLYKTTATGLIQDEGGAVTGLYAKGEEGTIQINAKAVVLATGGFSNNMDLMKQQGFVDIDNVFNAGLEYCNGFGVDAAIKAGGRNNLLESVPMSASVVEAFPGRFWSDPYNGNNGFAAFGKCMLVNQDGLRFVDEGFSRVNPLRQPLPVKENRRTYVVFDEASFAEHFAANYQAGDPLEVLADAVKANTGESLYKCETIEECAAKFGIDAASLKASFDEYNASAAARKDAAFGKAEDLLQEIKAPLYIGRLKCGVTATIGGVDTNSKYQVIDEDGTPIDGLFAVGVDGCQLYKNQYTVAIGAGTFSHNIFSGRVAADAAAAIIKG